MIGPVARHVIRQMRRRLVEALMPADAVLVSAENHDNLLRQVNGDPNDEEQMRKRHEARSRILSERAAAWFDEIEAGVSSILGVRKQFLEAGMDADLVDSHVMQMWSSGVTGITPEDDEWE